MRDPLVMSRNGIAHASPTFEARFWAKVTKTNGCWLWTGAKQGQGYGLILLSGQRRMLSHRASWEMAFGPIPEGMSLDHLCRNRACCNPSHLEPVAHAENVRRGLAGKAAAARTHCPQGHPYDEVNTYVYDGRRYCKECNRIQQRKGNGKRAECHPDRAHRGHGLCNACYLRAKRQKASSA